jgi:hypothetical protein
MSAPAKIHQGQLDSDFPPFATSGSYCRTLNYVDHYMPDGVSFDSGHVLPTQERKLAGSCGYSKPPPNPLPAPPTWDLPNMVYGTRPELANRTWFFSTLDSELAGNVGPGQIAEGGFKQVRPQSGGKKRKSRTDKSKKVRKGSQKPKLTVRKRKSTRGVRRSVAPPRKKSRKVKSKTRRSRQ